MVQGHHHVQVAVYTRIDLDPDRRMNTHIESVLPPLTYTALAVVHGVVDHPLLVHTHPKDESPLTGKIALGDFPGGGTVYQSPALCKLAFSCCMDALAARFFMGTNCGSSMWGHV